MSDVNVDVAKRAVAAFNARDVDAFAALTAHDFEWYPSMSPVESQRFLGRAGIDKYFNSLGGAWEHFRILPDEFRDRAELVLVLGRLEGRGKGSGATVDSALGMAFDLRGGAIWRIRGYLDHDEALDAVGMPQPEGTP